MKSALMPGEISQGQEVKHFTHMGPETWTGEAAQRVNAIWSTLKTCIDPQEPNVKEREPIPVSCPLTSTLKLHYVYTHIHMLRNR